MEYTKYAEILVLSATEPDTMVAEVAAKHLLLREEGERSGVGGWRSGRSWRSRREEEEEEEEEEEKGRRGGVKRS